MGIGHREDTRTERRGDRVHDMNDPVEKRRERNPDRGEDDVDRDIAGDEEDELIDTDEDDLAER